MFEIEPECWPAIALFLRLQTQWRMQDGCWLGMIYDSVFRLFDVECIDDKREMFADIQTLEFAALPILNEKLKNEP